MMKKKRSFDVDSLENRDPVFVRKVVEGLKPALWTYFRPEIKGLEHIPEGPVIFVGNHNGAMLMPDVLVVGIALYEHRGIEGLPYGLAHRLGIRLPILHATLSRLGGVRGTLDNGRRLLEAQKSVLIYPGGELDSMRAFRDRHRVVLGRRRGYVRLAMLTGAPIVPVVVDGAHETLVVLRSGRRIAETLGIDRRFELKVWPISLSLPWGLWIGVPPPHVPLPTKMCIRFLEPLEVTPPKADELDEKTIIEQAHARIHKTMESALEDMSRSRRRARRLLRKKARNGS